jgi:hypothetical protein
LTARRRHPAAQSFTARSAAGSIRHVRTLPVFLDRKRPHCSSTWTCWSTAGKDIASGAASSLTEAGARQRRSTIARRVGSASAWNNPSSRAAAIGSQVLLGSSPK